MVQFESPLKKNAVESVLSPNYRWTLNTNANAVEMGRGVANAVEMGQGVF